MDRTPPPPSAGWAYFLDFDGTLVEIAETPEAVVVPASLRALLAGLQRVTQGAVAIVTGRSLAALDRLLHPLVVPAAGQHGLERRDGAIVAESTALKSVKTALSALARTDQRLILEDKGLSVALHYRKAPDLADAAAALATKLHDDCRDELELLSGKAVFEFRPRGINKGDAIRQFLEAAPYHGRRAVMLGDDITDEDGFRVVNRQNGVSILVGARRGSTAAFSLDSVSDVHRWLAEVAEV